MGKRSKKCKSCGPLRRMMRCMDLPEFAIGTEECIEILGGNTVWIEGAKGIHTYETEEIKIRMNQYLLILQGEDLKLSHFGDGALRIIGRLRGVCWEVE